MQLFTICLELIFCLSKIKHRMQIKVGDIDEWLTKSRIVPATQGYLIQGLSAKVETVF